ncbi:MAG: hypothetical protein KGJ23_15900 [Euryarchaeota archaeon]|nr:hypothetical protein [Euryarchaeota archaeon]MDE1882138.1 hypothetical protein [Euryarchaeota archaeon]MDE2046561.1 hypothetical protein [Thermoplasmata archaeon]
MKLRTVTGNRYPVKCACSAACGQEIPAGADVKVVIDLDTSRPRLSYLPAHSPDAGKWRGNGSNGSSVSSVPSNGGNSHSTGFTPASALPAASPAPPAPPAPPKTPAPPPLALSALAGASDPAPSASAGVDWATSQLTFNAGPYESAKAGYAAYALPGETGEQLRARVHRVVLEDLEHQVRGIRELHEHLGDTAIRTSSPARAAGAPSGASAASSSPPLATARAPADTLAAAGGGRSLEGGERSSVPSPGNPAPPRSAGPSASPAVPRDPPSATQAEGLGHGSLGRTRHAEPAESEEGASSGYRTCPSGSSPRDGPTSEGASATLPRLSPQAVGVGGSGRSAAPARADPAVADLVARVNLELTDTSVRRKRAKEAAARKMCELRGLRSLRECTSSDGAALQALLVTMSAIDDWDLRSALGVPPPQLDDHLVLPA